MSQPPGRPACPDCDMKLTCPHCGDTRPVAGQVSRGWSLLTPLGRWEDVDTVETPAGSYRILIRTKQSGDHAWHYRRAENVDAIPPRRQPSGRPEIRVIEGAGRTDTIQALACRDTEQIIIPDGAQIIAIGFKPKDEAGWKVHTHGSDGHVEAHPVASKTAARALVRGAARRAARTLGVKLTIAKAD